MENCVEQLREKNVIAALKSIIRTYRSKHPHYNRPEILLVNYKSKILKYKFDRSTDNIVDAFVNNRDTLIDIIVHHYDTLWNLFTAGNYEFLHLLLKDNILDIRILNEYPGIPRALYGNKKIMARGKGIIHIEKSKGMLYYMCDIVPTLHQLKGYECSSQRRLQRVLWALEAVSFKLSSDVLTKIKLKYNRVKFLAILYDFISEPYITSAEVGNVAKYLEEKYGSQYNAKRVREDFEKYFPESKLPYQPRSLQHLCRCTIQQSLRDSGKYSHETAGLPLPRILQNYVAPRKISDFNVIL